MAAGAAVLSTVAGLPYGWLVARYRLRLRTLLMGSALLPLLLPPYAAALAWTLVLARNGTLNRFLLHTGWARQPLVGYGSPVLATAVLAAAYWPIVAGAAVLAARSVPPELEDSARLHLPDEAAAWWAAGPALLRTVPAAGLLVFLLSLADFAVSSTLGVTTYPVEIVNRFQLDRDPAVATQLGLPVLLLIVPLVALQVSGLNRLPVAPGGAQLRLLSGRVTELLGQGWCLLVLLVAAVLPLATLISTSMPLGTYAEVWKSSAEHLRNTLLSAGGGALLAVAVALVYGWSTRRRQPRLLDAALTLPYALPASLVAIAMIQLLNQPGAAGWLYNTSGALIWTYAILFFPFALKTLQPAWGHVSQELLDEGEVLGAGAWCQFRTAAWPTVRGAAAASLAIVAVLASRELDATALIRVPGGDTMGFRIQDYLHFASVHHVSAVCVLLTALSGAFVGSFLAWGLFAGNER